MATIVGGGIYSVATKSLPGVRRHDRRSCAVSRRTRLPCMSVLGFAGSGGRFAVGVDFCRFVVVFGLIWLISSYTRLPGWD